MRPSFSEEERNLLHEIMAARRDVREFDAGLEVSEAALERLLEAAHLAPSVGFSQPWRFVVLRDRLRRERIRQSFLRCREAESARYPEARREKYLAYRLEGILEAPLNVCFLVDLRDEGEHVLGTTAQPEAVRASVICAVQNFWLAARAEGLGVGWVSIVEPQVLRAELSLPPGIEPVAYLCVGHPKAPFAERPLLETTQWRPRRPLSTLIHRDAWHEAPPSVAVEPSEAVGLPKLSAISSGERCRAHWSQLAAPKGAFGAMEHMAVRFAEARGNFPVELAGPSLSACVAIFAADHGVTAEGVSAYPSSITAGMVAAIARGRATVNALARASSTALRLFDVGLSGGRDAFPLQPEVEVIDRRIRAGTANLRDSSAMTLSEARAALEVGVRAARELSSFDALGVGEVGIGNTTSAAVLVAALTQRSPEEIVGRGTGVSETALETKRAVVRDALKRVDGLDPLALLSEVGGLELAAMTGFMLGAAAERRIVVLDGFLTCAAALVARALEPSVVNYLIASHLSTEKGAGIALEALGLEPVLTLSLGIGEGTGAILGLGLLRSAIEIERSVGTFATLVRPATDKF